MNERNYLSARIEELVARASCGEEMLFSPFLTAEEALAGEAICLRSHMDYLLWGGYEDAERRQLGLSSMEKEVFRFCFPMCLIQVNGYGVETLGNRDVLGALMALGIKREMLGDIIARKGKVMFFAAEQMKDFLLQNVSTIGRCAVKLSVAEPPYDIPDADFEALRITVASMRADAVVGALAKTSRENASRLIDEKRVLINHIILDKKTKEIHAGDCLVVRGSGKWIIDSCGELTRKGRVAILCRKYI